MSNCNVNSRTELFRTSKGVSFQCDKSDKIFLCFGEATLSLRIQEFVHFRRLLHRVDVRGKLFDLSDECDYELIEAPHLNFRQRLTLCELIQLRELVDGAFFTIELNSLLYRLLSSSGEFV